MSSAVMTVVDAPTMPPPSRLAVTVTSGRRCRCVLRDALLETESEPSAIAPATVNAAVARIAYVLRLRRPCGRLMTGTEAKDVTIDGTANCGIHPQCAPAPFRSLESRGRTSHTAFASVVVSPLRKPLRVELPAHRLGDCAGRSPGSRVVPVVRPSQFPSGRNGRSSPLTVAGSATAADLTRVSVFPLASPACTGEPARLRLIPPPAAVVKRQGRRHQ